MAKIVVLGTGGTIAGRSLVPGDNVGYVAGQVGVQELLDGVPGLEKAAGGPLHMEQIAQIDSKDMDGAVWLALAERASMHLADPDVAAIVVTHGTDTLEETAWFLHCVLDAHKPVVLTCAMRPASSMTPDGPQNLLDAMAVARAPGARGVLAVCAGAVHGARQVFKAHPYQVNAFSSGDAGPVAWVEEGCVRLASNWPSEPTSCALQAIKNIAENGVWPRVEIIMSHAGASAAVVDALVRDGVQGLVVAAMGNGSVHQAQQEALLRAQAAGVAVRVASRCPLGQMLPKPSAALAPAWGLSPVKARIALMLQLGGVQLPLL